jgi:hypothetical protein
MDLFELFPTLKNRSDAVSEERSLRLISLSGIVYDDNAFYFELGKREFWGRSVEGHPVIGVGAAKIRADATRAPLPALRRHLRENWRCDVHLMPAGHAYVLDLEEQIEVLSDLAPGLPYLFILTPPRLGGGPEVPDALVQAVYLLPLNRWRGGGFSRLKIPLLRVSRAALADFLDHKLWPLAELRAQPWVEFYASDEMPDTALVRPVLALRGLQDLARAGALADHLSVMTDEDRGV